MNTEDLMTINEAAAELEVHRQTIWNAINDGRLTALKVLGSTVLKRADVEAYKQRTRPTGKKPTGRPSNASDRPST